MNTSIKLRQGVVTAASWDLEIKYPKYPKSSSHSPGRSSKAQTGSIWSPFPWHARTSGPRQPILVNWPNQDIWILCTSKFATTCHTASELSRPTTEPTLRPGRAQRSQRTARRLGQRGLSEHRRPRRPPASGTACAPRWEARPGCFRNSGHRAFSEGENGTRGFVHKKTKTGPPEASSRFYATLSSFRNTHRRQLTPQTYPPRCTVWKDWA